MCIIPTSNLSACRSTTRNALASLSTRSHKHATICCIMSGTSTSLWESWRTTPSGSSATRGSVGSTVNVCSSFTTSTSTLTSGFGTDAASSACPLSCPESCAGFSLDAVGDFVSSTGASSSGAAGGLGEGNRASAETDDPSRVRERRQSARGSRTPATSTNLSMHRANQSTSVSTTPLPPSTALVCGSLASAHASVHEYGSSRTSKNRSARPAK